MQDRGAVVENHRRVDARRFHRHARPGKLRVNVDEHDRHSRVTDELPGLEQTDHSAVLVLADRHRRQVPARQVRRVVRAAQSGEELAALLEIRQLDAMGCRDRLEGDPSPANRAR